MVDCYCNMDGTLRLVNIKTFVDLYFFLTDGAPRWGVRFLMRQIKE
jgi:hypothetical protein